MELKESVARQKQALLKTLSEAIKIRSVQEEAKPGMPFGEGPCQVPCLYAESLRRHGLPYQERR